VEPFAGLILAGGEGRRFGGPKAFARLPDRRSFVEACRDVLTEAGARPVAATLPPGFTAEEIGGLRPLPLPAAGLDMLASLRWGLRHLVSGRAWQAVVVLPVDHPLVAPATVKALIAAGGWSAIPTFRGKHGHPVCLAREVAERVARDELSGQTLRDILRVVGAVDIPVDDPATVANCNTPDALKSALELTRH
jgi:CTP:molybdopterin cytidylyltransferase MocA